MVAKHDRRALYLSPETTYAQARPADSTYLAIPLSSLGELDDQQTIIETNRRTGRTGTTPAVAGPTLAAWSSTHELVGFDAAVGDGDSAPAEDRFDLLLRGIAGTRTAFAGEGVDSHTTTALTLDSDIYGVGDLVYLVSSTGVGRWVPITADAGAGVYTLGWDPGITGTVARGSRQWTDDDGDDTSISYAALYDVDSAASNGAIYAVPGTRITSASIEAAPEQLALLSLSWLGDSIVDLTDSPPTLSIATNGDPAVQPTTPLRTACVWVGGTQVRSASVSVDFALNVISRPDTCAASGRSNMVQIETVPSITIQPLFDEDYRALRASQDLRSVLVQFGAGPQSVGLYMPSTQVSAQSMVNRDGESDNSVTFQTRTVGSGARWTLARA